MRVLLCSVALALAACAQSSPPGAIDAGLEPSDAAADAGPLRSDLGVV